MADASTPSDWLFVGRGTYKEFEEFIQRDSQGALLQETQQSRNVFVFNRYQIVPITSAKTLPEPALDTYLSGGLYAFQGDDRISASAIFTSGKRKWRCVKDDHSGSAIGANWIERHQTWEARDPLADDTWEEV